MDIGTTELLWGEILSGTSLDHRRPGSECLTNVPDHDRQVRHGEPSRTQPHGWTHCRRDDRGQ